MGSTKSLGSSSSSSSSSAAASRTSVATKSVKSTNLHPMKHKRARVSSVPVVDVKSSSHFGALPFSTRAILIISLVIGGIALYYYVTKPKLMDDDEEDKDDDTVEEEDEERHVRFDESVTATNDDESSPSLDAQPSDGSMDLPQTP